MLGEDDDVGEINYYLRRRPRNTFISRRRREEGAFANLHGNINFGKTSYYSSFLLLIFFANLLAIWNVKIDFFPRTAKY